MITFNAKTNTHFYLARAYFHLNCVLFHLEISIWNTKPISTQWVANHSQTLFNRKRKSQPQTSTTLNPYSTIPKSSLPNSPLNSLHRSLELSPVRQSKKLLLQDSDSEILVQSLFNPFFMVSNFSILTVKTPKFTLTLGNFRI